jgi:hypothetical protein
MTLNGVNNSRLASVPSKVLVPSRTRSLTRYMFLVRFGLLVRFCSKLQSSRKGVNKVWFLVRLDS